MVVGLCGGFYFWLVCLRLPPHPPLVLLLLFSWASVFLGDKVHLLSLTFPIAQVRCLDAFLASSAGALEVGDQ